MVSIAVPKGGRNGEATCRALSSQSSAETITPRSGGIGSGRREAEHAENETRTTPIATCAMALTDEEAIFSIGGGMVGGGYLFL